MEPKQPVTPAEAFLGSVREVFARNRSVDWTRMGLIVAALLALSITLGLWLGRRRRQRAESRRIETVIAEAGLNRADLAFLARIAAEVAFPVVEVMTSLAAFERATARALAGVTPPLRPGDGSVFDRIRRLRKALGFWPLPAHRWLLTTRELVSGDVVALGGAAGQVIDVTEATFAVEVAAPSAISIGADVALSIVRPDDSRYGCRVRILGFEPPRAGPPGAPARLTFGHDEHPDRQQHREHVRVRMHAAVTLTLVGTAPSVAPLTGQLVDLSAGGLSVEVRISADAPIRSGDRVQCSFAVGDGEVFEALAADVVAAEEGPGPDIQHLRLAFCPLPEAERDRLASAVARRFPLQAPHVRTP